MDVIVCYITFHIYCFDIQQSAPTICVCQLPWCIQWSSRNTGVQYGRKWHAVLQV